jgi:signal transduction histidine kinase
LTSVPSVPLELMKLSAFITSHSEEILAEWEAFASTLLPVAADMSPAALRDDAKNILHAIALDLEREQTGQDQARKSKGVTGALKGGAAEMHGTLRESSGFTLAQLVAEYRALRASVLRLWHEQCEPVSAAAIEEITRFNEGIDQALATSIDTFSQHAKNTRDTFLAVLGQDLRAPLRTVAVSAEYLAKPNLQRAGIDRTSVRLKASAARMAAMVHDLIEYSRAQLGEKMKVVATPIHFKELAETALVDVSAAYPDCPLELETSGDLAATADGPRVLQMLTNLLTNAAQYRDKVYSVSLSIRGEQDEIVVAVKNRGPVIHPEFFEAIFNPLVQLNTAANNAKRPATSLGLGLHIARTVALAHDGTISVTSTEKNGTVFTVRLPRKRR